MAESENGSSSRQEEDEMLTQMEEDERLLDESDGEDKLSTEVKQSTEDKQSTAEPNEKATETVRISSVGTLARNFMKNVRVGSNDVFAPPSAVSANNASKTVSSREAVSTGTELASGLPREYEMVKAARRNWLSAVALSGIGPLSRKVAAAGGGFETEALWSLLATATWRCRTSTA